MVIKIELIHPGWDELTRKVIFTRIAPLGLLMVAASTPPDVEVHLTDENLEPIDFERPVDLVGLTGMTAQAPRAYEIADAFRQQGVTVVMGGIHASFLPEEALSHVDAVVIGEAEGIWPQVIEDFKRGRLQQIYRADERPDLSKIPPPRWDLVQGKGYNVRAVQATRGCPFDCAFCSVTAFFGRSYRCRPIQDVVEEVKLLTRNARRFWERMVFFVDDNIIGNKRYAKELFRALIPLRIRWNSQAPVSALAEDDELMELARASGCMNIFAGLESLSRANLSQLHKPFDPDQYAPSIRKLQRARIGVMGSFMFGLDHDDKDVFRNTVRWCIDCNLEGMNIQPFIPLPGTREYDRYEREGRILDKNWARYNFMYDNIVAQPKLMTADDLRRGVKWAFKEFYSWRSIFKRLAGSRHTWAFSLPTNLGYKMGMYYLRDTFKETWGFYSD